MKAFSENLVVGLHYTPSFILEAMRAIRGRLINAWFVKDIDDTFAQHFFEARSSIENDELGDDVVAIQSAPYQKLIFSKTITTILDNLNSQSSLVDFGFGAGHFLKNLRSRGYKGIYTGYEIDRVRVERLAKVLSDQKTRFLKTSEPIVLYNVGFLCNVLVYNQDNTSLEILARLRLGVEQGGVLLVVEPHNKWYWEFVFNGVRLASRTPSQLNVLIQASGWRLEKTINVSLFSVFGIPFFPIAYAFVATRSERSS